MPLLLTSSYGKNDGSFSPLRTTPFRREFGEKRKMKKGVRIGGAKGKKKKALAPTLALKPWLRSLWRRWKRFLEGLERFGRGDWRNISRWAVKTRTPTQVASHAQKFYLRQSVKKDSKRKSIHDITT